MSTQKLSRKQPLPSLKSYDYIDTLYLSLNLENHSLINSVNSADISLRDRYESVYRTFFNNHAEDKTFSFLGSSMGYEWYQLKDYRIGFMPYAKAKTANQPNCIIQYSHDHLFSQSLELKDLLLPFLQDRDLYMIKRIDITKTCEIMIDLTRNHGYVSPWRTDTLNPTRFENTVYLGHRRTGNVFRLYPKGLELKQSSDYGKVAKYKAYFGSLDNLYTFEHELHRKYLYNSLGIDTLSQLDDALRASRDIVSKIQIFPITDKNVHYVHSRHPERIPSCYYVTPALHTPFKRPPKKKYNPSFKHLIKRINQQIEAYASSVDCEVDKDMLTNIVYNLANNISDSVIDELDISFSPSDIPYESLTDVLSSLVNPYPLDKDEVLSSYQEYLPYFDTASPSSSPLDDSPMYLDHVVETHEDCSLVQTTFFFLD